jgi:adenylate kinase
MRIVLMGPPGSGKGTQGDLIARHYGLPRICTGDLLRRAVQDGTPLGKRAQDLMGKGDLVSDDIVEALVRERIASQDCAGGYVLDGFPRTIGQALSLEVMDGGPPDIVIGIDVRPDTLIHRLSLRRVCSSCQAVFNAETRPSGAKDRCDACGGVLVRRQDDSPDVIRERIRVYHEQTEKLEDYYRRKNAFHNVDGEGTIEETFDKIVRILDSKVVASREGRRIR